MSTASRGWMNHRSLVFLLLGMLLLSACSAPRGKNYYLLQYPLPPLETQVPKFPIFLRVKEPRISQTYDRLPIVYRFSLHKLQYYNYHLWAVKPQRMIADLLVQHLRKTGLFARVSATVEEQLPDYTITSELVSIEELDSIDLWYAHLAMNFSLIRERDGAVVASYTFDRKEPVKVQSPSVIVQKLSEILFEEITRMIVVFDEHLSEEAGVEPTADQLPVPPKVEDQIASIIETVEAEHERGETFESSWLSPPIDEQLALDTKQIPTGKGAIFIPAMTEPLREPLVEILPEKGEKISTQTGTRVILDPGKYEIRFGSGIDTVRIRENVEVREGETSIVKPVWAGLVVRVVDEQNVAFRGSYELIYMPTREVVGVGFGVDEETGEQLQTWILKPGLYKLIRVGENYRARKNFATVELKAGVLTNFVLVLDPETENFLGAGVFEPDIDMSRLGNWKISMTLGGDLSLESLDNVAGTTTARQSGTEISFSLFLDTITTYTRDEHYFYTRMEIEEGQTRSQSDDRFSKDFDSLDLDSIYIYRYVPAFGPYVRFGIDTNLLPTTRTFEKEAHILVESETAPGTFVVDEILPPGQEVQLANAFSLLALKEGAGINLTLLKKTYADLNTRFGVGSRQLLTYDFFTFNETTVQDPKTGQERDIVEIRPSGDNLIEGIEGAVVGTLRFSRWVLASTDFDILVPFDELSSPRYTWQNSIGLRLGRYAALNYITRFIRDPEINSPEDPLSVEQNLLLRISYDIF